MHAVSNSEFFYCAYNYKEVDDFRFEDFCHVDGCEYFPNFQDLTERANFFADAFLFLRVLIVLKPICFHLDLQFTSFHAKKLLALH